MTNCDRVKNTSMNKIKDAYDPFIHEFTRMIRLVEKQGLDPEKFYDVKSAQVINLVKLVKDLSKERNDDLSDIKNRIDQECLCDDEAFMHQMVNLSTLYFTHGLSIVLPKYIKHVNVQALLNLNPNADKNPLHGLIGENLLTDIEQEKNTF